MSNVVELRPHLSGHRHRAVRARTIITSRIPQAARVYLRLLPSEREAVDSRPRTRGECEGGARPCPFVGCRHNLYLDASKESGSVKLNFPDLEPEDMPAESSCALDVAARGDLNLEEVAPIMNLTRERVRQIEVDGLRALSRALTRRGILQEVDRGVDHVFQPSDTPVDRSGVKLFDVGTLDNAPAEEAV